MNKIGNKIYLKAARIILASAFLALSAAVSPAAMGEGRGKDALSVEEVADHLGKAGEQLDRKDFDAAREYTRKILDKDANNRAALEMLARINKEEEDDARIKRERAERLAEEEERAAREEERLRALEIANLLGQSGEQLDQNRFDRARDYARKIFDIDEGNRTAQWMLTKIDDAEAEYRAAEDRARAEQEARRQAEEEARRLAEEEAEARRRAEKIASCLAEAGEKLDRNDFDKARDLAKKALGMEEDNPAALEMFARIEKAEQAYNEEKENARQELERERMLQEAQKEQARIEESQRRAEKKVGELTRRAREYLEKEDYSNARKYAKMAQAEAPENGEVADLVTAIDKEEIFGKRPMKRLAQEKKIQKAAEAAEGEDPFHEYDEGRKWTDYIVDLFKRKKYELGDVRYGKVYTIDECVETSLKRSQRMIMADQQVKLAEMRVWETRRDLLPSVTARYEASSGKIAADNYQRHYRGRKYDVEVKHTVFDGFGTWFEIRQTQTNLSIVKLERDKVVNEIVEETKKAYYNLDKTIKALALQDRNKEIVDRFFRIVEEAHKDDFVSRVDYLNVKGQKLQADFQHISAIEDVDLAKMVLFQAMNMDPDRSIEIEPVAKPGEPLSIGLENCYSLAIANNPEFRIKRETIEYYDFERKMMKAKGWPKVEFQGSFGSMVEKYEPMFLAADWRTPQVGGEGTGGPSRAERDWEAQWFAGGKVTWPVWGNTLEYNYVREHWAPTVSAFRGSESATSYFTLKILDDLKYFSNLQEARVGFERAKYEWLKAKKDLLVEVKEIYFKYRKALLNMEVAEAKLEHQSVFMDVLRERLRYGEMQIEKVVEEYDKLIEYEYGVLTSYANYFISLTELNKSIGISDYFKPGYENREYEQWQKLKAEEQAALDQARRDLEDVKKAEKVADYLGKAGEQLDKNNFDRARGYAGKAQELDPENAAIKEFLLAIDSYEHEYRRAEEAMPSGEAVKRAADEIDEEQKERDALSEEER